VQLRAHGIVAYHPRLVDGAHGRPITEAGRSGVWIACWSFPTLQRVRSLPGLLCILILLTSIRKYGYLFATATRLSVFHARHFQTSSRTPGRRIRVPNFILQVQSLLLSTTDIRSCCTCVIRALQSTSRHTRSVLLHG
jgi:hypothetical protein